MTQPASSPSARASGCHHIGLPVKDFAGARRFYGELLGLEEIERPAGLEKLMPGVWYSLGSTDLHLFEHPHYLGEGSPFGHHIALHVGDFDAAVAGLRESGCEFEIGPVVLPDGVARAFVRDPTGNLVEITDGPMRA